MNRKGFTLVELLAVIVILSLLALITTTSVSKIVLDAKDELSETQMQLIKTAAETWGSENLSLLPDNGECIYLTLKDLKNYGLLDNSILNPENNQQISDDLQIKITTRSTSYGKNKTDFEIDPNNIQGCNKIYAQEITFYINNIQYKTKQGMTWNMWIQSDYNEIGVRKSSNNVMIDVYLLYSNGVKVNANSIIISDFKYNYNIDDENLEDSVPPA